MRDPDRLDDVTDEELLHEVWLRFGESWCAFSSGVRPKAECPVCHETEGLTRHHLVPVAAGAGKDRAVKQRYVKLCRACHERAHEVWGPGSRYAGPRDREVFVAELRKIVRQG